ncbi:class F sortase [Streptomyces sp. NPDC051561]|uniref:class F sortase n=1 Tax=Streptomyces sp. NPDC051561 TaxID=3365658 RepID=UPI0037A0EF23
MQMTPPDRPPKRRTQAHRAPAHPAADRPAADPARLRTQCALVTIAALSGLWLIQDGSADSTAPPQPSAAEAFAPGRADRSGARTGEQPAAATATAPLPPSDPVRLRIPQIRVDTPVMRLGLDAGGGLDVPPEGNPNLAGWYQDGTAPGAAGTAIVAGHVDTTSGPAVFYRLGSLRKGHTLEVLREDGRTAVFSIDAIEVYDAEDFPDRKVYGKSPRPELRVITCGGGFVEGKGYRGNVVAYAHLTGVKGAAAAGPFGLTPPTGRTQASRPA